MRSCGPATTEPENPQSPKIRKKYKIPHPRKYRKNTEKIRKRPENGNFWAVLYVFGIFCRISGGQPGVGDFVFFSYFRVWGFSGSVAGPQDRNTKFKIREPAQTIHHKCSARIYDVIWDSLALLQGHLGPSGPKWQKESETSSRKVPNGVENESKLTLFQLFWLFFDSVWDFLGPRGREAPGTRFGLFSTLWARRAQMTPVAGQSFRKM